MKKKEGIIIITLRLASKFMIALMKIFIVGYLMGPMSDALGPEKFSYVGLIMSFGVALWILRDLEVIELKSRKGD